MRLTHVQHEKILARVQAAFEFFHLYLGNTRLHWLLLPANPAEFIVVDQLGNRRMLAASGAVGIFAKLQLAKLHAQRVDEQQPAD